MTELREAQNDDDIKSLYDQIATTIEVKESPEPKRSLSNLSTHSTISISSSSSSSSSSIYDDALEDTDIKVTETLCMCKKFLSSRDSVHCSQCDQIVPFVERFRQNADKEKEKITSMKAQLDEKHSVLNYYKKEANTLNIQFTRRQSQILNMTNKIQSLHQDIEVVQLKHVDEIAHIKAIEHSKKLVENEMHDLTQKLFEEANSLVLKEKEEKLAIQTKHDKVKDDFESAESELKKVQSELQELRKDIAAKDQESQQLQPQSSLSTFISTHENYLLRAQLDMASLQMDLTQPIEINPDYHEQVLDNLVMEEFKQFCIDIRVTGLSKLSTLSFMKSCIKSDIEPCLRFGPSPKMSSKKIMDAILVKTCLIEPCPPGFAEERINAAPKTEPPKPKIRLWERFSASTPTEMSNCCQACGRVLEGNCWRFRISYFDEWALADRYCYERISSVIEFYSFLRKLKVKGYEEIGIFPAYQECTRLQLQMFLSR